MADEPEEYVENDGHSLEDERRDSQNRESRSQASLASEWESLLDDEDSDLL